MDVERARGRAGWLLSSQVGQIETPVLAIAEDRLHWGGMSVLINRDPFLAVAQAIAAVEALRDGPDSRPDIHVS